MVAGAALAAVAVLAVCVGVAVMAVAKRRRSRSDRDKDMHGNVRPQAAATGGPADMKACHPLMHLVTGRLLIYTNFSVVLWVPMKCAPTPHASETPVHF